MKFINHGDTIEGKRVSITTRKQSLQAIVEIEEIGKCFKYLCQKNATATIVEELSLDAKERNKKLQAKINLNINDCISGDSIDLYSLDRLQFSKEANFSSKHGIQHSETKRHCRAQIRIPFRFALE